MIESSDGPSLLCCRSPTDCWHVVKLARKPIPSLTERSEVLILVGEEYVHAAGCVVVRMDGPESQILLIWTQQYPDPTLPKGRIEPDEDVLACGILSKNHGSPGCQLLGGCTVGD